MTALSIQHQLLRRIYRCTRLEIADNDDGKKNAEWKCQFPDQRQNSTRFILYKQTC